MPAFRPSSTVSLSVSSSTASVSLGTQVTGSVVVTNTTGVTVFVKFGIDSATATTSDYPVLAGTKETLTPGKVNYAAGITSTGSGTVYFTLGEGE